MFLPIVIVLWILGWVVVTWIVGELAYKEGHRDGYRKALRDTEDERYDHDPEL